MLRDDTGAIRPECATVASMAIAGGILMELALLGRIDTDLKTLFIVDPAPVGDDLLDEALHKIAAEPAKSVERVVDPGVGASRRRSLREGARTPGPGRHSSHRGQAVSLGVFAAALIPRTPGARSARRKRASCRSYSMTTCRRRAIRFCSASRIRPASSIRSCPRKTDARPQAASRRSSRSRRSIARSAAPRRVGAPRFDTGWRMRIGTPIDHRECLQPVPSARAFQDAGALVTEKVVRFCSPTRS